MPNMKNAKKKILVDAKKKENNRIFFIILPLFACLDFRVQK